MIQIGDDTTLIGTSELRNEMPKITKDLKKKNVIVMKRGKPIAVLQDFEKYEENKKIVDAFEDIVLGYLAKDRDQKSKTSDYISQEALIKKLGISL